MTGRLRRPDLGAAGGGGRLDLTAGPCVSLRQIRPVSLFPQVSRRSRRSEAKPHWYGSIQSLADHGIVARQACALAEPAGSCLVAASPLEPVGSVAGWLGPVQFCCEQAPDLADGPEPS